MTRGRKGFTLIELLIVTVLGALVVLASLQVLLVNRRAYTAQAATIAGQQTTRMGVEILFAELRELSPAGGDILEMTQDSLRVRLMRKFSIVCATDFASTPPSVTVIRDFVLNNGDTLYIMGGTNQFVAGDSVFIFADNNEKTQSDDAWIAAEISAVESLVTTVCPQDLDPALKLEFNGQGSLFAADSVGIGAAVRSYEEFAFGTTTLNGDVYLARRDTGRYVPMAGPLAPTDGLEFVYRDLMGDVTAVDTLVAQIEVTLRTGSEVMNSLGQMVQDSVQVWIYTRN
jgi:prepilin-type N-terminal cleavage/methylation domain-containing protein